MEIGDYVRTEIYGIHKITRFKGETFIVDQTQSNIHTIHKSRIIKSSQNILELLEPLDLLYVDISPDDCGGIVVPKIPDTINELNSIKRSIATGDWVLESVVTHEQLINDMYKVGE